MFNKIGLILFLCIFSNQFGFAQSSEPAFPIRAWVLLDYNMPYLRKMIPLAAKEGITDVQLCHRIGMQLSDYLEPKRNRDIKELIALAHQYGIKAHVWTHELDHVPPELMKGGKVAAYGPEFWQWMAGRYQKLLIALPEVDGIVITLTETKVPIDDDNLVLSPLSPTERFRKMAQTIYDVLHPLNKQLILRTFTWIVEDYDWMLDAFRELPEDIIIMSKVNWGDWFQHYPSNPFIGKVAPHRQIVEFDLVGQYHGDTMVPWVYAEYIQQEMQYDLSRNAAGVIARVDWSGHVYGTANEFNAVAFSALAKDPLLNLDQLWQLWAKEKYGVEAAPYVISALKRSNKYTNLTFFTLGFKVLQMSGTMNSLSYMDGTRIMHSLFCRDVQARWKPELIPTAEKLLQPTMRTMWEAIAEKEKAVEIADSCLKDLKRAQRYLTGSDFTYLTTLFQRAKLLARSWRWINEAYFRYLFLGQGDITQKDPLNMALDRVADLAEEVEHCFGNRIYFLQPNRMQDFVSDIRLLINPPVKWFAKTNIESGRIPLPFDIDGDGRDEIIVNGLDNRVHAFKPDGREIWGYDTFGLRVRYLNISDPVSGDVDGDGSEELLIGAADGFLYVFSTGGELKWKYKTGNGIIGAPLVISFPDEKPITVCASLDGYLYGISAEGELLWKVNLGERVMCNPLVYKKSSSANIIVGTREGRVIAIDTSGEMIWKYELSDTLTGALALHQIGKKDLISVTCGNAMIQLNSDGQKIDGFYLKDKKEDINVAATDIVLKGRTVFIFGTNKGNLWAIDSENKIIFQVNLGREIRTPVKCINKNNQWIILVGVDNAIVAVNELGIEVGRFTAAHDAKIGTDLLINETTRELLFTAHDRKLYVIDLDKIVVD